MPRTRKNVYYHLLHNASPSSIKVDSFPPFMDIPDLSQVSIAQLRQICKTLGLTWKAKTREQLIEMLTNMMSPLHHEPHMNANEVGKENDKLMISTAMKRTLLRRHRKHIHFIRRIQKWYRMCKKYKNKSLCCCSSSSSSSSVPFYTNQSDFITLEPITVCPFCLVEETGHMYQFHPMSLAQYFLQEGNFINPYTRKPLNVIELKRLDKMVKQYDSHFVCLYEEHKRITIQRSQEREHVRVCQMLHQECVQLVPSILALLNHQNMSVSTAMFRMCNVIFPRFFETFCQLFIFDQSFACESAVYIINMLREIWNNKTIASTPQSCHIIEVAVGMLNDFIHHIMPILPAFIPEMLHIDNPQEIR